MAIIPGVLPPSRATWETVVFIFQFFPIVTVLQWLQVFGIAPPGPNMGKMSTNSKWNVPGKIGWFTMEIPAFLIVLYCCWTIPKEYGISITYDNWILAGCFTIHYVYRAIICPLVAPSMSPMHIVVWASAFCFQVMNGLSIGGWLGGYGNHTRADWSNYQDNYWASSRMELGLMMFGVGLFLNVFHDDELREIRRAALRNQKKRAAEADQSTGKGKNVTGAVGVDKHYVIPKNGGFIWIFYPHYVAEWFEWAGYCLMGGPNFKPGFIFLINEIATMAPRAVEGKNWYIQKFGKEKVNGRKAIIPGLL